MDIVTQYLDFSSDRWVFMIGLFLTHEIPLLSYQLLVNILHRTGIFSRYLIQPNAKIPDELMGKAIRHLLVGHLVVQPILLYFLYDLFSWRGLPSVFSPLPTVAQSILTLAICAVLCDTGNYWSHRLLHRPVFYARFHKQHHEFRSVVPLYVDYIFIYLFLFIYLSYFIYFIYD